MAGRVLRKRILRDLRSNAVRYTALAFLIILSMFIILSVVGAAYTIREGSYRHASDMHLEDGQFTTFLPLSSSEKQDIEDTGIILEEQFYLDYLLDDGSTLRIFKNREKTDCIDILYGSKAEKDDEIVLERRYCDEHGISVGDVVTAGEKRFTVSGIGTTPDYDAPYKALSDAAVDSLTFGTAFVTSDSYENLLAEGKSAKAEEYVYSYRFTDDPTDVAKVGKHQADERDNSLKEHLKDLVFDPSDVKDPEFIKYWHRKTGALGYLFKPGDTLMGEPVFDGFGNLTQFLPASDNMRILAGAADVEISFNSCLVAGVILLILFTYIISVFVVHSIDKESAVIGTLYAMGVKKKEIISHYLILPVLITAAAGIIGTIAGFSPFGIPWQMQDTYDYYSVPAIDVMIPFYLWIYALLMPPLSAFAVNLFVIRKKCDRPVLRLLQHEQSIKVHRETGSVGRSSKKQLDRKAARKSFTRRFSLKQISRGKRAVIGLLAGLFISLLLMMISIDTTLMCGHVKSDYNKDTKYEYMYMIKYPDEEPPSDGTACYMKGLKKEHMGYNMDVTVLGLKDDNPYFDTEAPKGGSNVYISSAMAQKYGIDIGDSVTVEDTEENRSYIFRVTGISKYATSFYIFMDKDSALELFEEDDGYYNVVFSDHKLDIPSGKLYGTTTKADISKAGAVFVDLMKSMIVMMIVISALILAIEMYLLIRIMIDKEAFGISLMKIFGWRRKEINSLYLNGSFIMIAAGTAVLLPLSKFVMDHIYPYFVSNVPCGMDLSMPWWLFPAIYLGIIGLYLIISRMLVRHLKTISPVEVLKNRE